MVTYEAVNDRTYRVAEDGQREILANFVARITNETRTYDGETLTDTTLTIEGTMPAREKDQPPLQLPATKIEASAFAGLTWVTKSWGVRAIVSPGTGVKEDLRTAIQEASDPTISTIHASTGWTTLNNKPAYLHAGGAITPAGNDPNVTVSLPPELTRLNLTTDATPAQGADALLTLIAIAPPNISWPLAAAALAPIYGAVDFAVHLSGRTGTFKSELISLYQALYGPIDSRTLPGSWSSTANALEAQAYRAKNAAMVVDDFVPSGGSAQVRKYNDTAEKLIRAQGNQAGRARLSDASNLQTTMYPRGIILSTGEDTPDGHSIRARMMILELSPGNVTAKELTAAQAKRHSLRAATADMIRRIAQDPSAKQRVAEAALELRTKNRDIGHTRTPSMLGTLQAVATEIVAWLRDQTSERRTRGLAKQADTAILEAANAQAAYLEDADPCDVFASTIRQAFGAGLAHVRTLNGGIPRNPTILGYTEERSTGSMPLFKSHGPVLGWVSWDDDEIYIDATTGLAVLRKIAGQELSATRQTLLKRLKDAGMLTRVDEARGRNTVRITADNHPRQVISLSLSCVLGENEKPNEDAETPPNGEEF